MIVKGDKKININSKISADGYFIDKWGNKIRPDSKLDSSSEDEGTAQA